MCLAVPVMSLCHLQQIMTPAIMKALCACRSEMLSRKGQTFSISALQILPSCSDLALFVSPSPCTRQFVKQQKLYRREKTREAASPPIFPIFLPDPPLSLWSRNRIRYQTRKSFFAQGLIESPLKSMEKFPQALLFSRLFPAPIRYVPLAVQAGRAAVGAQSGGIFGEAAHKGEPCLPVRSVRLLSFPLGPNLRFICFPMLVLTS